MSHDPFERDARHPRTLPRVLPCGGLPPVLVACRCGVDMTVAWSEAVSVTCFGCGRAFDAPPDRDPPPPPFRPERQTRPDPAALAACFERAERGVEAPATRARGWVQGLALAALLLALLGLGVRLVASGPDRGDRARQ